MRKIPILLLGAFMLGQLISLEAFAANVNTEFAIEEHKKELIRQGRASRNAAKYQQSYNEDRDLMLFQMEIITGDEETRYIIMPGDTITMSFEDRSETNEAIYKVSGGGEINIPLVGAVVVGGLSRKQAREEIGKVLGVYIRHPHIKMLVNSQGRYIVMGAAGPGVFDIAPNLSIMEAIVRAGYNSDKANFKSVMLMRGGINNPVVKRLNLKKMIKKGDRSDNILVKPGDMIYVPDTFIYNIDRFKNIALRHILDYYSIGGAAFLED